MQRKLTVLAVALCAALAASGAARADEALAKKHNCVACHQVDKKSVGPAYKDVAKKYKGQADAVAKLSDKVKKGGSGVWGPVPMPPNAAVPDADIKKLVEWVLAM
ncbi:c-type cytochrome [Betaproteobacteria bacterium PRO7]|jgi:cytochrome c|nr:c-type cytochrome [Burkholderiaceae bacterium]MDL1862141.1 c-type cytochrome [Betaproteobacteria bacterium PRO7]